MSESNENKIPELCSNEKRNLEQFANSWQKMVAQNESAFNNYWKVGRYREIFKNYTPEDIERIIKEGSLDEQLDLSRCYFQKDCLYKRILIYYATLLKYVGMVIPNPSFGKSLSTDHIKKKYFQAVEYVEQMNLQTILTEISRKVVVDGAYYGIIKKLDKTSFTIMDLPVKYCITRNKTADGVSLVEFNVTYFDTLDEFARKKALQAYPKEIVSAYKKYRNGKLQDKYVFIDPAISLCFQFFETPSPLFLGIIPSTIDYDQAVEAEKERDLEEIRKIIVQQIPHLNDGTLLFEPPEAEVMHRGAVGMVKGNKNVSVLTTYANVDSIVSKTSSDAVSDNLKKMLENVYSNAGTSIELFASTSNLTLSYSIKNDIALMMILGHKYETFITSILNKLFSNSNISFNYVLLPVSIYTENEYTDELFKLAQSGYSFLLPAISMGISQRNLLNIKELENEVMELDKKLIPLASSYTQSGSIEGSGEIGRPEKEPSEKSPKTEENEKSIDNNS